MSRKPGGGNRYREILASRGLSRDLHTRRLMLQPDTKNVPRGIQVTLVTGPAISTFPMSYTQPFPTFRAAERTALRTGYGCVSFVGFNKHGPVPAGFIAEHVSEYRPASIRDGLCHSRLLQLRRIHVADNYQSILARDTRGLFVKMVPPGVGDLCMDGANALLVVRSLGLAEGVFIPAKMLKSWYHCAVSANSQGLKTEIDSNLTLTAGRLVGDFALKCCEPAPASILDKRPGLNLSFDLARCPVSNCLAIPEDFARLDANISALKRHPAERPLRSLTGSKPGGMSGHSSRASEHTASFSDCVGVNAKFSAYTASKFGQREVAGPSGDAPCLPIALGLPLNLAAVVPHKIHSTRVALKTPAAVRILDAKFVRQDHPTNLGVAA